MAVICCKLNWHACSLFYRSNHGWLVGGLSTWQGHLHKISNVSNPLSWQKKNTSIEKFIGSSPWYSLSKSDSSCSFLSFTISGAHCNESPQAVSLISIMTLEIISPIFMFHSVNMSKMLLILLIMLTQHFGLLLITWYLITAQYLGDNNVCEWLTRVRLSM